MISRELGGHVSVFGITSKQEGCMSDAHQSVMARASVILIYEIIVDKQLSE